MFLLILRHKFATIKQGNTMLGNHMEHQSSGIPDRVIFHIDCDAFFASVEETFHPEYKAVPMAVAGDPESRRGIILAKNALAKGFGIKTAETIWSARQKCPQLTLVPPRHRAYGEFCGRVNAIYEQYTDQVEQFSIDESFLDVTGSLHLFGKDPTALAHEIRRRVEREIGITVSVGISWNKIFAKLGSDLNKPNGVCLISHENVQTIAWPLPASNLFLIGKNTAEALDRLGVKTIGQLAQADEKLLRQRFGKMGDQMYLYANGLDDSPVARIGQQDPMKSIGNGMTFQRNLVTRQDIRTGLIALCDSVARRLRRADMKCNTVQVTIKNPDLHSIQRQKSIRQPTHLSKELAEVAMEIVEAHWNIGNPIRLLTVTAQNLVPASASVEQLSLFGAGDEKTERSERLEKTMDAIRGRYGRYSIQQGVILHNDLGINDEETEEER